MLNETFQNILKRQQARIGKGDLKERLNPSCLGPGRNGAFHTTRVVRMK